MPSAMKGDVLTSAGDKLTTLSPTELINLFNRFPKVGLNFGKIFVFASAIVARQEMQERHEDGFAHPRPSPSSAQRRRGGREG